MNKLIQRIISHLPSVSGMASFDKCRKTLAHSPIDFEISRNEEDGEIFYSAKSVNFNGNVIMTTGKTLDELNQNIKDAIFTAFDVPAKYCDYKAISSNLPIPELRLQYAT